MMRLVSGALCTFAAIAVMFTAGPLTGCKKKPKPRPQPPVKITNVVAKVVSKNHRRVLKVDYLVVNINNRCNKGVCAAEVRTKISVKRPDRHRVALDKDDLHQSFTQHSKEIETVKHFSYKLELPVATPAGSYRLRIEAADKVGDRLAVKKVRFRVPPEVISIVKIKSLRTKTTTSGDELFVDVYVTAESMHNRCTNKRCKVDTDVDLRVTTPQGSPFSVTELGGTRKIANGNSTWLERSTVSWMLPLGVPKKEHIGKWTFKVEIKDHLSKKSATKQTVLLVEKTKKKP